VKGGENRRQGEESRRSKGKPSLEAGRKRLRKKGLREFGRIRLWNIRGLFNFGGRKTVSREFTRLC